LVLALSLLFWSTALDLGGRSLRWLLQPCPHGETARLELAGPTEPGTLHQVNEQDLPADDEVLEVELRYKDDLAPEDLDHLFPAGHFPPELVAPERGELFDRNENFPL
jgi:hypothetical protein